MKRGIGLIGLMGVMVLAGCAHEENQAERLARFKREVRASQAESCTNFVTGLRTIVQATIHDSGDNPARWTGEAVVEFVNPVGGVERTNLPFLCRQWAHGPDNVPHVIAFVDEKKIYNEKVAAIEQRLKRLR